jgi:cytoskeleton protein RodZ
MNMGKQKELIPMLPGDILHHEREKKGLTIGQVADRTRIKDSVLLSIESGLTDHIPPVYLRGYVRNYATHLGLDPEDLERHLSHIDESEPEIRTVFTESAPHGSSDRWLKATSYAVASVLVAALVWQFTHEAVRFSQGEGPVSTLNSLPAEVSATADGNAGSPPRPAQSHLTASIASIEVMKRRGEKTGALAAEEAWAAIADPSAAGDPLPEGSRQLDLSISADTWVEIIDAAGAHLELDLIRAGNSRSYQGVAPFRILLGRASAIELYLDGEAVDLAPYTRGNVARMTLGGRTAAEAGPQGDTDQG